MPATLYVRSGGRWVETGSDDPSVTSHDAAIPQPQAPLPQAIEEVYAPYADGLHFFKASCALVSIQRQPLQTTVVVSGPMRSVARVSRGENGQPTPENPSTIVSCDPVGVWTKATADSPNEPFSPPQTIDLFELPLMIAQFVNDAIAAIPALDPDVIAEALRGRGISPLSVTVGAGGVIYQDAYKLYVDNVGIGVRPVVEYSQQGNTTRVVMPSRDDVYLKGEADAKFLDTQFFNANAYYGPSVVFRDHFGGFRWKMGGFDADPNAVDALLGLSRWGNPDDPSAPVVPRPSFEFGDDVFGFLAYLEDLEAYAKLNSTAQAITAKSVEVESVRTANVQFLKPGGGTDAISLQVVNGVQRLVYQSGSKTFALAFTTELAATGSAPLDLSPYAAKVDSAQSLLTKTVTSQAFGFGSNVLPAVALAYTDTGEGFGERLILSTPDKNEHLVYASDLASVQSYVDTNYATRAELEKSPVLYWDTPSAAPVVLATDATKNRWLSCGTTSPVAFVAGRAYRIECRLRLGPLNADALQQWYGVRATGESGAALPISGTPLVSLTGLGASTVIGSRAELKAAGLPDGPTSLYRFVPTDDWQSDGEMLSYSLEFVASETTTVAVEFGFAWGGVWKSNPTNVQVVVAVVRLG